jgi:hypothetical protein
MMERLSLFRFGTAVGLAWGGFLGVVALVAWVIGPGDAFIQIMSSIFPGYGAGLMGGVVGGVWGCCVGFVFGVSMAWVYNRLPIQGGEG